MLPLTEAQREALAELCRRYGVARLDLFGSAAAGSVDPARSDLDFLVEFRKGPAMNLADQYFGLLAALEQLFGRKVDLLTPRSLRNPYFIREVEKLMQPGTSALFVLDHASDMDVILHRIQGLGGTVLKTNVDPDRAKLIQSTLAGAHSDSTRRGA